jgi:hypothetical protein
MSDIYDQLQKILTKEGPGSAISTLTAELRSKHDYHGMFYAQLMGKRLELGLSAVQTGSNDVPSDKVAEYESAIRQSARSVGQLFLDEGDIAGAWPFFRMIQEPAPIADAIEKLQLDTDDSERTQQVIQIALHEGVHPVKGYQYVLERYGICNAITTMAQGIQAPPADREKCVKLLVRTLHEELRQRLLAEAQNRGESPPDDASVRQLLQAYPAKFEEDFYHIDTSHLSSVVQFGEQLSACKELELELELCEYGMRLNTRFRYPGDPPFEDMYRDHHVYFHIVLGQSVEEGLKHFWEKAKAASPEEIGMYPAVVLVNLLDRLGRSREAVDAFQQFLSEADQQQLPCPTLAELCGKLGDYRPMLEVARKRGDLVNYTAGLLQIQRTNRA